MSEPSTVSGPSAPTLLVEGAEPGFPTTYRRLLREAHEVDVALTRLRIATLRLRARDVERVRRMRVLLAELTTAAWEVETHRALLDPRRDPVLRLLIGRLVSGEVEVRAAPLAGWSPDFTVFRRTACEPQALLGPHWLEPTPGLRGPRFAFLTEGGGGKQVAAHFDRMWSTAYDVGPAVARLLGGTLAAIDRLTNPPGSGIVSAPQNRGSLPP